MVYFVHCKCNNVLYIKMSVLHTKTTYRPWHFSQHALDNLFGDSRWKDFVVSIETDPVGSGCIAEVQ